MSTLEERIKETTEKGIQEKIIIENEKNFLKSIYEQCTEDRKIGDVEFSNGKKVYMQSPRYTKYKLENSLFVYVVDSKDSFEEMIISPTEVEKNQLNGCAYIYAQEYTTISSANPKDLHVRYEMNNDKGEPLLPNCVINEGISYTSTSFGDSLTIIDYIRKLPKRDIGFELLRNDLNKIFEGTDREIKTYTDEEIAIIKLTKENADVKAEKKEIEKENVNLKAQKKVLEKVNARLQTENKELTEENLVQKQTIKRNQKMLSKTLKFANKVRESALGKIFFNKPLKELDIDQKSLPEGEEK